MPTAIVSLVAILSTTAFLALWFWVVRRELSGKQKTVDAAKAQLAASRQHCMRVRDGPGEEAARQILERSDSIYGQTVRLYNETLKKPWNYIPGLLMGFRARNDTEREGGEK
ncbi:MAG: hypothetical protein PHD67_11255 [Oscillospiraceae bacterium]|nr:hypothetical protein [Oscillospiraceae bacterium]